MPPCPVPGSAHAEIPAGETSIATLENVINHLKDQDTEYLKARCQQLLADLGVVVSLPTQDYDPDLSGSSSGGSPE